MPFYGPTHTHTHTHNTDLTSPEYDPVEMLWRQLDRRVGLEVVEISQLVGDLVSPDGDGDRAQILVHAKEILMFCRCVDNVNTACILTIHYPNFLL